MLQGKGQEQAAVYYAADGFDTSRRQVMGRQSAGDGFIRAYLRHGEGDRLNLYGPPGAQADFSMRYGDLAPKSKQLSWITPNNFKALQRVGALFLPDPGLSAAAWRRRYVGNRAYSICGITHTISSHGVLEAIESYCVAPVQAWDALICTSQAARRTVQAMLAEASEYIHARVGSRPPVNVSLPVIPLGIHSEDFATSPEPRRELRESLEIDDDEVVILFLGRLSSHAKANPVPMFQALEQTARRSAKRIHLLLAGWFPNDAYREAFAREVDLYAPSVRYHVIEAPDNKLRRKAYSAADIFVSLSDNIQETFGLTPLEAMAAGLPVVVSDWDGYRDTVRHGKDGFLVPTYAAPAGSGTGLSRLYAYGDSYDNYVGRTAQFCAIDLAACSNALTNLIEKPDLRLGMGKTAQEHVRAKFDWSAIIPQYQMLWSELADRRKRAAELAPRIGAAPARPAWEDPFRLFAHYSSVAWTDNIEVSLGPNGEAVEELVKRPFARLAGPALPSTQDMTKVLDVLSSGRTALSVNDILSHFEPQRQHLLRRSLLWLAKFGLVTLHQVSQSQSDSTSPS